MALAFHGEGLYLYEMRVAILIDGGHLRVITRQAKRKYSPDFIAELAAGFARSDEMIQRILYYDCAPYTGIAKLPVSGRSHEFKGSDRWLRELSAKDLFAVRLGVLKFRGFKPKSIPIKNTALQDDDFTPDFEQKGVDMRIGLDIATYSETKAVNRLILVTNDTDCIPAMKHGRKAGLQIILATMVGAKVAEELKPHSDYLRVCEWP